MRWKDDFIQYQKKFDIPMWIRFLQIPHESMNLDILVLIAAMVRRQPKVDESTMHGEENCFDHICVTIQINRPIKRGT